MPWRHFHISHWRCVPGCSLPTMPRGLCVPPWLCFASALWPRTVRCWGGCGLHDLPWRRGSGGIGGPSGHGRSRVSSAGHGRGGGLGGGRGRCRWCTGAAGLVWEGRLPHGAEVLRIESYKKAHNTDGFCFVTGPLLHAGLCARIWEHDKAI